jgi:hypothetical protein
VWDLRALAAAEVLTDERAARSGVAGPVAGFYSSLHRNLGELDRVHEHLDQGLASVRALGDDGYGQMIKNGLDRLADRLP